FMSFSFLCEFHSTEPEAGSSVTAELQQGSAAEEFGQLVEFAIGPGQRCQRREEESLGGDSFEIEQGSPLGCALLRVNPDVLTDLTRVLDEVGEVTIAQQNETALASLPDWVVQQLEQRRFPLPGKPARLTGSAVEAVFLEHHAGLAIARDRDGVPGQALHVFR